MDGKWLGICKKVGLNINYIDVGVGTATRQL